MIEIITEPFKYEFMIRSLITATASGIMLSILGPFAINRNMGFMADAMAHATLPIIAVGVFLGFSISELGVPASILIAIFLGYIIKNSNVGEDTAIGIIFSSFFALGFILISVLNVTINLEDLLFGQILAVSEFDVLIVIAMCIAVVSLVIIFFKQLLFKLLMMFTQLFASFFGIFAATTAARWTVGMAAIENPRGGSSSHAN